MRRFLPFALLLAPLPLLAQGFSTMNGRTHPELRWMEAETAHFRIAYPARLAGIENAAAAIAESTYAALSHNLGTAFDRKIPIYLSDEDEIVNGFAAPLFASGYTMIWVHQNANAEVWTGPHKWLRKVLAHELTHLFQFRAVRPNVGFAGQSLGRPFPRSWAEGLAQYETERWDSERGERWLRTAALEGRLDYDDGASAWNGRLLYAVGNSQVRFFAQQYGDSALVRLLAHRTPYLGGLVRAHDFPAAFHAATGGEHFSEFTARWRRHVSTLTGSRAAGLTPPESLGVRLRGGPPASVMGQYTYDLRQNPDTSSWTGVRLVSLARPVVQLVVGGRDGARVLAEGSIAAPVALSPDGQTVAFSQTGRARHGSLLSDLYTVDVPTGRLRTLTRDRRASAPTFSPDGRRLAFVASTAGTANVFVRTLTTGREVQATHFTGDVQISSLAWRPAREQIAAAVFDADGQRRVHLLDLGSGRLFPLTPAGDDYRGPVWNPDGSALATTSLRDGVPNVFVVPVGAQEAAGTPERVTAAVQGATATAWLAPGATPFADTVRASPTARPAPDERGRLVVLTGVSKGSDRAYLVGATHRVPEPVDTAPGVYAAWETHTPPRVIGDVVPPDPSLVTARRRYDSVARTQHLVTVPFPYAYDDVWGVGVATVWAEPLGKHQVLAAGAVTPTDLDKSFLLATYRNATLAAPVEVSLYRYPGAARLYGSDVLVERLVGGDVSAQLPLELGRTPYTNAGVGARLAVRHADPLNPGDFAAGALPLPVAGTQVTLSLGVGRRMQRPWRDNVVHPLDGYGVKAVAMAGVASGQRARFVREDVAAYAVLPAPGLSRLYVYGRLASQQGASLPQDYLGLSRLDEIQLGLPSYLPLSFGRNERVRGYQSAAVGRSVAFGSVEYRVPFFDLNTTVLGMARLGTTALAAFADGAVVGQTAAFGQATARLGYGLELKNAVNVAGLAEIGHAVGVAWPAERDGKMEVYYRIRFGTPF